MNKIWYGIKFGFYFIGCALININRYRYFKNYYSKMKDKSMSLKKYIYEVTVDDTLCKVKGFKYNVKELTEEEREEIHKIKEDITKWRSQF